MATRTQDPDIGETVTIKGTEVTIKPACEGLTGRHYCIEHDYTAQHNMDANAHQDESCRWVWMCPAHGGEAV